MTVGTQRRLMAIWQIYGVTPSLSMMTAQLRLAPRFSVNHGAQKVAGTGILREGSGEKFRFTNPIYATKTSAAYAGSRRSCFGVRRPDCAQWLDLRHMQQAIRRSKRKMSRQPNRKLVGAGQRYSRTVTCKHCINQSYVHNSIGRLCRITRR